MSKGAIWRIWDLHVHSPASYGGKYEDFIENASKSKADVIGINDYNTLSGYKEIVRLGSIPNKVIFPIVELRLNNVLHTKHNPNGVKLNLHIIFDNNPEVFPKIETWLNSLEYEDDKGNKQQLGATKNFSSDQISFNYAKILDSLEKNSLYGKHALIWLPYDEYGGIDEIDPVHDGMFKAGLINRAHIIGTSTENQINFFKWNSPKFSPEDFRKWFKAPIPCIKGSDAHCINYPFGHLKDSKSKPTDRYCWISSDTTFNGLRQIIIEPDRVYIGDEPDLLKRVKSNKTKFIKSLTINKTENSSIQDLWFNNFHIKLNSSLVAIIGNKGNGKSAIADIIALCGNSYQDINNYSFLTSSKFRKLKPYNLSENFEATLEWIDNTKIKKRLNENPDKTKPERVRYIPQNFLERLCANVDSDDFEKEIEKIIFSHTPTEDRFGKHSLNELIEYQSSLINDDIFDIKSSIAKINIDICELENKATDEYKNTIKNTLSLKKQELQTHIESKPLEIKQDPTIEQHNVALMQEISSSREIVDKLKVEIKTLREEKLSLNLKEEELKKVQLFFEGLDDKLKNIFNDENLLVLDKYEIDKNSIFKFDINLDGISEELHKTTNRISEIDSLLLIDNPQGRTYLLDRHEKNLNIQIEQLDKPAKEQQKYVSEITRWEEKKETIEGSPVIAGSLKFFEREESYLDTELESELTKKYQQRIGFVRELYRKKNSLNIIRKKLYIPVTRFIENFKELKARYDVKLDVNFEVKNFSIDFLNKIHKNRIGSFSGEKEGFNRVHDIVASSNFDTEEGFIDFINNIVDNLKYDKRDSRNSSIEIGSQLKNGIKVSQLYDFIFSGDYLLPTYQLKLGEKNLQELSPGERGALLLIFYLILDNEDIPLIIDQPEENLDNESVYYILVHFIKKAKERRQIIIVTHNPNLAVVCDADQIIHTSIEKHNKNLVSFSSGALENKVINQSAINILEGTLPAFNNRDMKYFR